MPVILGGNTGIYLASLTPPAPSFDPDAQAFITAAAITDPTQQAAINTLVVDLKGYNVWSKMKAVYPFVGGTATSMKWNLKDPRDLDAAFRLLFIGGGSWDNNGYTPNGSNGYADTKLTPSTGLTINNTHLSVYLRASGGSSIDIGATAASDFQNLFIAQQYFGNFYADSYAASSRFTLASQTAGLLTISRTASNSYKAFKNSSQIGTTITSTSGTLPTWSIYIGASNRDNTSVVGYSAKQCAFASIGDGLLDSEANNLYLCVQQFNTTLGRQV
jgi:hypothetical protein